MDDPKKCTCHAHWAFFAEDRNDFTIVSSDHAYKNLQSALLNFRGEICSAGCCFVSFLNVCGT